MITKAGEVKLMDFGIDNVMLDKIAAKLQQGDIAVVFQIEGEPEAMDAMADVRRILIGKSKQEAGWPARAIETCSEHK